MKRVEVVAGVILHEGRILAARRGPDGETGGLWEFPGGKVEAGESCREALERELAEELGVACRAGDHLLTVEHQYRGFHLTMHVHACSLVSGIPRPLEHAEIRWLLPGDLEGLDWAPADLPVVDHIREGRGSPASQGS